MFKRLAWAIVALATCAGAAAQTPPSRLTNGLTVIVRPVAGAKSACLAVVYRIGADQDPAGQSGLAHLIEHVYITAAAGSRKSRTVDEFMKAYPAGWEALTGSDFTILATVFPKENIDAELSEAADRMSRLKVESSDLEREKPRMFVELRNMFGGLPAFAAWNLAHERVRPTPNGGRRGGVPQEIEAIGAAQVEERWRRYYKPANAILVLTGDIDADAARKAVDRGFSALPAGEPAPKAAAPTPPRVGSTEKVEVTSVAPETTQEVCLMAAAPAPSDRGYAPFLVLATRLQARMLEVAGVSADQLTQRFPPPVYYPILNDPATLSLSAIVAKDKTPESVVDRLKGVITAAVKADLQPGETTLAKRQFGPLLGLVSAPDAMWAQNPYGLAFTLARQLQWGVDSDALNRALAGLQSADLRRAADTWLAEKQWATLIVSPR